jgi:hypothetical protein
MAEDMHPEKVEKSDPITVTVPRACEISGLGLTTVWKFIKEGRLRTRRIPGLDRTLVLYSSLQELLTPGALENTAIPPPRRPRGRPRKPARELRASLARRSPQDRRTR